MIYSSVRRLFSTLVLAEHNGGKLNPITSKLISAATKLGKETNILFLGHKMESAIKECQNSFCPKCFQKIIVGDHPLLENKFFNNLIEFYSNLYLFLKLVWPIFPNTY